MYGTVARLKVKPGKEADLMKDMQSYDSLNIDGFVSTTVYRLDSGSNEYIMAVAFRDKASYTKNADDPAQDKRFQDFRSFLESDPEWSDGEIIYSGK